MSGPVKHNHGFGAADLPWSAAMVIAGLILLVVSSIFFGIEFTDSGFIQGISWAIHSGGTLYEDIDYVRPPLTPFLWHFVFWTGVSEGLEVLFRSLVTLEKALTGLLAGAICLRHGVERKTAVFIGCISFIFLVHHLPAMPWHTVDGLFFLVTSAFLFSHRRTNLALVSALLAAACKQSFIFFPPLLFVIILLDRQNRTLKSLTLNAASLGLTAAAFSLLFNIEAMLSSGGSDQSVATLIRVAVLPYLQPHWWHLPAILGAALACLCFRSHAQLAAAIFLTLYIPLSSLATAALTLYRQGDFVFSLPPGNTTHLVFLLAVAALLHAAIRNGLANSLHEDRFRLAFLLLAGSWMSTISWGYNNHIFSFGLIVAAWALTATGRPAMPGRVVASLILVLCVMFAGMKLLTPYRTAGILEGPQLSLSSGAYRYIVVSELESRRLDAMDRMFATDGCVEIYPSAPQAHMIQARHSELPAGWMLEVEYPSHERTADILKRHSCRLFIERDGNQVGWSAKGQEAAGLDAGNVGHCVAEQDDYAWMIDFASCDISAARQD